MKVLFDEKHVGTTKVIKKNSNPQWNEKILLKLPHNFDFSKSEYMDVYSDDNEWKSSFAELRKDWFLLTKNDLLNEILEEDSSNENDIKQTIIDTR